MILLNKIRQIRDSKLYEKRYKEALFLDKKSYENYLKKYYSMMMNRCNHSFGKTLNFENPISLTEKIQWLKLYDNDIRKGIYSDKYLVRDYIKKTIGEKYLNELITIKGREYFEDAFDIDFSLLPESFVLKCTHASHFNFIIKDKSSLSKRDVYKIKKQINKWLKIRYAFVNGLELQYENTKPAIIIEKYLSIDDDLPDYKFFCFDGKARISWIDEGRYTNHLRTIIEPKSQKIIDNLKFRFDCNKNVKIPNNFEEMVKIAETLSKGFKFVRVDLYNLDGRIYFGELTFTSGSGYECPEPANYDIEFGKFLKINNMARTTNQEYRNV